MQRAGDAVSVGKDSAVHAALGAEGVPAGQAAVPAAAYRYWLEIPRHDRASGCARLPSWPELDHPYQSGRHCATASTRSITAATTLHVMKTRGVAPGARGGRVRRGVRRGTTGRGTLARQGARSSRSATPPGHGTLAGSGRSSGGSTMRGSTRASTSGCSRCRIGPRRISGITLREEQIEVVPLYFAQDLPTVVRDGSLIVVDDARMRLRPGEQPVVRRVRFRSLGCYPLTGRGGVRGRQPRCDPGGTADAAVSRSAAAG